MDYMKFKAIWQLMRLEHCFMLAIAVFLGAVIVKEFTINLLYACLSVIFLGISAFSLNDYFDLEIDIKNRRIDRPLVRKEIKPSIALIIYAISLPIGIILSYVINKICFFIALLNAILLTLYDVKLKRIKIIGNFYIAFTMAIPFIFGSAAVRNEIPPILYFLALIAFFAGVEREIMKDVIDFKGDKEERIKSFPFYFGEKRSNFIASSFYTIAIVMSYIPFFFNIDRSFFHDFAYLSIVSITNALLIYVSININERKNRELSLIALFIGLIAFLVGAFI